MNKKLKMNKEIGVLVQQVRIKYRCESCDGKVFKTPTSHHGLGKWHCENNCNPCKVKVEIDHG